MMQKNHSRALVEEIEQVSPHRLMTARWAMNYWLNDEPVEPDEPDEAVLDEREKEIEKLLEKGVRQKLRHPPDVLKVFPDMETHSAELNALYNAFWKWASPY